LGITEGDRLRWTKTDRSMGQVKGQIFSVKAVDETGHSEIVDRNGNHRLVNLSDRQYVSYALVSTVQDKQSQPADRVMAVVDAWGGRESLNEIVSRAKSDMKLYTANLSGLKERLQVDHTRQNASHDIPLLERVNHEKRRDGQPGDPCGICGAARAIGGTSGSARNRAATSLPSDGSDATWTSCTVESISIGIKRYAEQRTIRQIAAGIESIIEGFGRSLEALRERRQSIAPGIGNEGDRVKVPNLELPERKVDQKKQLEL
jgi:hypothetical protein